MPISIPNLDKDSEYRIQSILRNYLRRNYIVRKFYQWDILKEKKGLGIFVMKQYYPSYKPGLEISKKIIKHIENSGFKVILSKELSSNQKRYFQHNIMVDSHFWISNFPHLAILVYDNNPISMIRPISKAKWKYWKPLNDKSITEKKYYFKTFPNMDNLRLLIKNDLRIILNRIFPKELENICYVHSTDNFEGAWEYVEMCFSDKIEEINNFIKVNSK